LGLAPSCLRARLLLILQNGLIGCGWHMQKHHPGVKRLEIAPAELVPDFAMMGVFAQPPKM